MSLLSSFVINVTKFGLHVMCKIDAPNLDEIPMRGPLIAYSNHTGQIEVPIIYTEMQPRPLTGFAKAETWDIPFFAWLFNLWGVIPVRRGEADMEAIRKALNAIAQGKIFGIAPEGTRNGNGILIEAQQGMTIIALKSGAPILPIAHWGGENFRVNFKRFKRTHFQIRIGRMFTLDAHGERVTKEIRQQMTDECMYQLAKLLPEEYRGFYSDMSKESEKYLKFI
jgi:1-acyl-sn-glycerol-3-phosphate acyltransferase